MTRGGRPGSMSARLTRSGVRWELTAAGVSQPRHRLAAEAAHRRGHLRWADGPASGPVTHQAAPGAYVTFCAGPGHRGRACLASSWIKAEHASVQGLDQTLIRSEYRRMEPVPMTDPVQGSPRCRPLAE